MATGRLGVADLAATTNTSIYTVPTGKIATLSVSVCNRTGGAVTVRLALCATGTPADTEYIEYGTTIAANSTLTRTGLVLDAAKILVAYGSATGISVVAWGFEDAA